MASSTTRTPGRPLVRLVGWLVVIAGMWLAGGLAAAAACPLWTRWLAAALVWPLVPLALLILVNPRLGLRRVAVVLAILAAGASALWWRPGLVEATTTHAAWMLAPTATGDAAAPPAPAPGQQPAPDSPRPPITPVVPSVPIEPAVPSEPSGPSGPSEPSEPSEPSAAIEPAAPALPPKAGDGPRSRCFRAVVTSAHSNSAYSTTLVDLDADGVLDLVAIESARSAAIRAWKGDRDGHFHPASTLAYDGGGLYLAVLDVDRDGKPDLATSDHRQATVTLWLGAGDGSFTRGASQTTYRSPLGTWAADLDADGFSDLIVAHYFHIEVMRGGPRGKLRATPWLRLEKEPAHPTTLLTPEDISAADLNGDGLLDLVIPKGDVTSIELWTGRGRGGFRRTAAVASCYAPMHSLVGDVIEDGAPDVVVRCGGAYTELFAGDADGGLERRGAIGPEHAAHAGALVDLTGDGHLDLISATTPAGRVSARGAKGTLVVHAGDGKGGFQAIDALPLVGFQHRVVGVVDIDGDTRLDVVYECFGQIPGGHVAVAFGTGCVADE